MSDGKPTIRLGVAVKIPNMQGSEMKLTRQDIQDAMQRNRSDKGIWRTCLACDHWMGGQEQCMLNALRPPAFIIAYGCDSFEDYSDDIPF